MHQATGLCTWHLCSIRTPGPPPRRRAMFWVWDKTGNKYDMMIMGIGYDTRVQSSQKLLTSKGTPENILTLSEMSRAVSLASPLRLHMFSANIIKIIFSLRYPRFWKRIV